jgi:H+/Cl- antiporter ClcA
MKNSAASSILTWSILMLGFGTAYLFVPNFFLSLLDIPKTDEPWIRILGLLIAILGGYYAYCAHHNDVVFMKITIPGRILFAAGLAGLVILKLAHPAALILGGIDTVGAFWTWIELRKRKQE